MILAILQARSSSSRLPGKVMHEILGKPMIFRQIERIRFSSKIDQLVVATSENSSDDFLAQFLEKEGVLVRRGPLEDVLQRFALVVDELKPSTIVRLTADCPLTDAQIIDMVITSHLESGFDYTSNTLHPTFPDGLDVECFSIAAFTKLRKMKLSESEREHVTLGLYSRPTVFQLNSVTQSPNFSNLRWTVDFPDDMAFVKKIYDLLYDVNEHFGQTEILDLLKLNPQLSRTDQIVSRNTGLLKP